LLQENSVPNRGEIHMRPALEFDLKQEYLDIIVTLRDPVERFVSAFHYSKNFAHDYPERERFYYQCWPTVNSFAESLDDMSDCSVFSRRFLANVSKQHREKNHMHMGNCFYTGGALSILKKRPLWIVHQESLLTDLTQLMGHWGYTFAETQTKHSHASHGDKHLSEAGKAKLRKFLDHEYWAQEQLEMIFRRQQTSQR
jgi:hypothetical protein